MIQHLSRRSMLEGIGSLLGASLAPVCGLAWPAAAALPELEDIFGARRIAKLKALYQAGKPVPDFMTLELLFDADGRFRVSREFRDGMTRFLCSGAPVAIVLSDETVCTKSGREAWQPTLDAAMADIIARAGMFPPGTNSGMPRDEPMRFCYWRNEDWRAAGWPPPTDPSRWIGRPGKVQSALPELAV